MKKILIITPTPTHPTDAGNRAAIITLATELMHAGYEVHCLYFPAEEFDKGEMSQFFNGNFYTIDRQRFQLKVPSVRYYIKRIFQKVNNVKIFILEKLLGAKAEPHRYNKSVDENLTFFMRRFTREIAARHKFDIVISEYVWLSGLLQYFPKKSLKIIDTHDRFSNRYLVYKNLNKTPEWNSLFPSEEAKGLRRADLLLALSKSEKEYFEKISGVKTLIRLPAILNTPRTKKIFEGQLLYFASDNIINLTSIEMFLKEVFPLVRKEIPTMKLLIGGKICDRLVNVPNNVEIRGTFENPGDFYNLGDIIINPEIDGTGFKVKTFEALSYGMPVICTKAGAEGVLDTKNDHIMVVNNFKEFSDAIIELSLNEVLRNKLSENAYQWAKNAAKNKNTELLNYLRDSLN